MVEMNNVAPLFRDLAKVEHEHNLACQECSLYRLCLPLGLHSNDLAKLDTIINRSQSYSRGAPLFNSETPFNAIYVVRSGSFKTTVSALDGREQVTGFYFPGEFIGLDAIYQQSYQSTAKALESSSVCALPFEKLQEFSVTIPLLQKQLMTRLSKELSGDKNLMFLLGKKNAEEKLATFLLSISKRFQDRGFSAKTFQLSMARADIANHLGLAVETISRLFSRLDDSGVIEIQNKAIAIKDIDRLKALCG